MPCDSIRTTHVEFSQATDLGLMEAGLKGLGYLVSRNGRALSFWRAGEYTHTFADGQLTLNTARYTGQNADALAAEVKRGYSEAVVNQTARRNGWQVTWATNAAGNREAKVQKRG